MPRYSVRLSADVWYQTLCFLTRIEIVSYQLIGKFFRYLIEKEFGDDKPPFLPIDSIYVYNLSPYREDSLNNHTINHECCDNSWPTPLSWWEIFLPEMKRHEKTPSCLDSLDQIPGSTNQTNNLFSQQKLVLINRDFQDDYNCLVQQNRTYYGEGIVSGERKSRNKFKCCFGTKSPETSRTSRGIYQSFRFESPSSGMQKSRNKIKCCVGTKSQKTVRTSQACYSGTYDEIKYKCPSSRMQHALGRKVDKDYLTFVEPLLAPRYVRVLKFMYVSDSYTVSKYRPSYVDENDEWLRLFETFPHAWLSPELTVDITFDIKDAPFTKWFDPCYNYRQLLLPIGKETRKWLSDRHMRYSNKKNVFEKVQPWVLNCKRLIIGPTLSMSLDEWWLLLPKQCKSSFPHCSPDCSSKLQCACLSTSPIRLIPPIGIHHVWERPVLGLHADDFLKWLYCGRRNSNITNTVNDNKSIMSLNKINSSYYIILSPYTVDDFVEKLCQDFQTSVKHSHQSEYRIVIHLLSYLQQHANYNFYAHKAQIAKTMAWLGNEELCTFENSDDENICHSAELENPRTNERLTVSLTQATETLACDVAKSRNLVIDRQLMA
ncbi:hypothetical protein Ddc_11073 [Ditylenchus destructor]|nr:hypothetical protein Ddc_11073 [Ditylenchus destructor]